jgi:hypothetical protein
VQTIKAIARRPWGDRPRTHGTWYQPLKTQADIDVAVHWALGRPGTFVITASDADLLSKTLDAAERARGQPSDEEMADLATRSEMEPVFADSQMVV